MENNLADIDVVILCGGLGTRLRSISRDMPKSLMPFAGKPFIEILMESLLPFGFKRFVLCVGHLREKIYANFYKGHYDVIFSEEKEPLGTGGALKNASSSIQGSLFLVMNGDSICPVDFSRFHSFHRQKGGILSLVLAKPQPGQDYGVIELDENLRITSFREKKECFGTMFINGGIYFMQRDVFHHMPVGNRFSLENDLFPKILSQGCYGYQADTEVLDIGTPEKYLHALQHLSVQNSLQ